MAKVTLTIEDLPDGKVKVVGSPNFETMAKMEVSGEKLTSAQGLALFAMNRILQEQKKKEPTTKIWIPKLGRD